MTRHLTAIKAVYVARDEKRKRQGGFTLVELMVIICILGILASIAMGQYKDAVSLANGRAIMSNLRIINGAVEGYYAQYGKYPSKQGPDGIKELVQAGFLLDVPRGLKKGERFRVAIKGEVFLADQDVNYWLAAPSSRPEDSNRYEAVFAGRTLSQLIDYQENHTGQS